MPDLKAIILAAGVGSRLRPLTDGIPKCLVPVAGRPILGWQIDALLSAGIRSITVVAGYRADQVIEFCRSYPDHVHVVVNADFARTNNMYSLTLGTRGLDGSGVILSNGDVVFDPAIARLLVQARQPDLIAVEPRRHLEESMKVVVDGAGRIVELSKGIGPDRAYGVSIDVYRFGRDVVDAILAAAARLIDDEKQANLWTEVAIAAVLPTFDVRPLDIAEHPWVEIDNFDDLAQADHLFMPATHAR